MRRISSAFFVTLISLGLAGLLVAQQVPIPSQVVGPQRVGDGVVAPRRLDGTGAGVVVEGNGKYAEPTQRGQAFIFSTAAAGVLLAAPTTTFFGPVLWNPSGSNKDLFITKIVVGYVSGTTVAGHVAYAYLNKAGSQAATGSAILTATFVSPTNAYIGSGTQSAVLWSPAAGTFTTAPTYLAPMGVSVVAQSATAVSAPWTMVDDVDGRIVIAPGNAFFVCANAGITLTATVTIYVIEAPTQLRAIQ